MSLAPAVQAKSIRSAMESKPSRVDFICKSHRLISVLVKLYDNPFVLSRKMVSRCVTIAILSLLALLFTPRAYSTSAPGAVVQTTPETNAGERKRGIELYRQQKVLEASRLLQKAVKENKADDEAWYYLGLALLHQPKKAKDAAKAFETAIKLRPGFAPTHLGLAYALLLRNKSTDAIREAQAALSIDRSLADAHYIIGVVRLASNEPEAALAEAREANRLNPKFPSAYLLKSQALSSVYANGAKRSTGRTPTSSALMTPEQRAERHKKRLEDTALLKESAESLQTYLRLNPSDSSAELWRQQLATLNVYGSYTGEKSDVDDAPLSGDEVTTKVRVTMKPEPAYTESARQAQVTGTVVLRSVFASDGTVRHILVLTGLPNGLTEAAIRAAGKIKFIPATLDGRPVSMFIQLEYNFNLY